MPGALKVMILTIGTVASWALLASALVAFALAMIGPMSGAALTVLVFAAAGVLAVRLTKKFMAAMGGSGGDHG